MADRGSMQSRTPKGLRRIEVAAAAGPPAKASRAPPRARVGAPPLEGGSQDSRLPDPECRWAALSMPAKAGDSAAPHEPPERVEPAPPLGAGRSAVDRNPRSF